MRPVETSIVGPVMRAGPDPADPFGLVAKRLGHSSAPVVSAEEAVEVPDVRVREELLGWKRRALEAEDLLAKARALLTAIGIVASKDAARIGLA